MIFHDKNSFLKSFDFYTRLKNYSMTPFSKSDIVKVVDVYDLDFEIEQYYELIIICEYGESDRIDIPKI